MLRTFFQSIAKPRRVPWALPAVLIVPVVLAGCGSPHPAPIVHRTPASRPASPPVAVAAPAQPARAAPESAPATTVQTTPVTRGPIESRSLTGADVAGAGSANLLKAEPNALRQPYSDSALAQMSASAAPAPQQAAAPAATPTTSAPVLASAAADSSTVPGAAAGAGAGAWMWPADGKVVQDFSQPGNMGLSIAGQPGDPVVAVNDGRVIFSGAGPRSYGNLIIVKHDGDILSVYAHNRALLVKEGQSVRRGQRIAELGSSGSASPQLHFEIRRQGRPVDPRSVLPARK